MATVRVIFLTIFFLFNGLSISSANQAITRAIDGQLDLSHWNETTAGPIKLDGEWSFFPNALADNLPQTLPLTTIVPKSWTKNTLETAPFGHATYTLSVTGLKPEKLYGFRMLDQATSFTLFINDNRAASNGTVGSSKSNYLPNWQPVTGTFFSTDTGRAEFVIEIANFDYYRGGLWNSVLIGTPSDINHAQLHQVYTDMFLFSSLLVMGLFFLGMYCVHPQDKGMIYFSLFCLCISFRVLLTGERIAVDFLPQLDWSLRLRLEYMFGYLLLPFLGLFIAHIYPTSASKPLKYFYGGLVVLAISVSTMLPHHIYSSYLSCYKGMALLFGVYFLLVLFRMMFLKKTGSIFIFITFLALIAALIKETYFQTGANYIPYAGFIFIVSFSLVTMRKYFWVLQKNRLLESKAGTDSLTGLFNRDFFLNYLDNYLFSSSTNLHCSLLFLDLDSFKTINDNIGHDAGDAVLKDVSRRLQSICRTSDIICRYGGDEFLIFLGDDDKSHATALSSRVIEALKEPIHLQGNLHHIGVSIGISHYNGDGSIEHMIKQSDHAMYLSKKRGGNTYTIFNNEEIGIISV